MSEEKNEKNFTRRFIFHSLIGSPLLLLALYTFWHPAGFVLVVVLIGYFVVSYGFLSFYNLLAESDQGLCEVECALLQGAE